MDEPDEVSSYEYFYTVGSGMENFVVNELTRLGSSDIQHITSGKVYFSSNLSPLALLSLKTAERLFILVRRESQFLINRPKRDAISRFRAIVEGDGSQFLERCLNKWNEFYRLLTLSEYHDMLKFRVSCKCSGKIKNAFPSSFLGKILAGSLLNINSKLIPELRNPQLEVLVHADVDLMTIGLACCLFNQPLSKRPYLSDIRQHVTLRPTLCSAMLNLALNENGVAQSENNPNTLNEPKILLDPMCGTGMILAEAVSCDEILERLTLLGSDSDVAQISEAIKNIQRAEDTKKSKLNYNNLSEGIKRCHTHLFVADARALPLQNNSVHYIVSDLPFGLKHTCKPWPKHLQRMLTKIMNFKDDTYSISLDGSSSSKREICNGSNLDSYHNAKEKCKTKEQATGVTTSDEDDCRRYNIDVLSHSSRGVKRKNANSSDSKTMKLNSESTPVEDARNMLPQIIAEMNRVLVPGGRAILIISETLKPSLLEAVSYLTSPIVPSKRCSNCEKLLDMKHSDVCISMSVSAASESLGTSQRDSFEINRLEDIDNSMSKRRSWLCTKEHRVRLGILDAVICVFDT